MMDITSLQVFDMTGKMKAIERWILSTESNSCQPSFELYIFSPTEPQKVQCMVPCSQKKKGKKKKGSLLSLPYG